MISIGDTVRLSDSAKKNHTCPKGRKNHRTAVVSARMGPEYGVGSRIMDRDLAGCLYWNVDDLVKVYDK